MVPFLRDFFGGGWPLRFQFGEKEPGGAGAAARLETCAARATAAPPGAARSGVAATPPPPARSPLAPSSEDLGRRGAVPSRTGFFGLRGSRGAAAGQGREEVKDPAGGRGSGGGGNGAGRSGRRGLSLDRGGGEGSGEGGGEGGDANALLWVCALRPGSNIVRHLSLLAKEPVIHKRLLARKAMRGVLQVKPLPPLPPHALFTFQPCLLCSLLAFVAASPVVLQSSLN